MQHLRVQSFQQGDALAQAPVVVHLARHRPPRDGGHLLSHAVRPRQLVDHLDADERRVHVHHDQPLAAAQQRLALQGAVERSLARRRQECALKPRRISVRRQRDGQLDGLKAAFAEPVDALDVRAVGRQHFRHRLQRRGPHAARDDGERVTLARLAGIAGQPAVFQLQAQRLGGEEQLLDEEIDGSRFDRESQHEKSLHHHPAEPQARHLRAAMGIGSRHSGQFLVAGASILASSSLAST